MAASQAYRPQNQFIIKGRSGPASLSVSVYKATLLLQAVVHAEGDSRGFTLMESLVGLMSDSLPSADDCLEGWKGRCRQEDLSLCLVSSVLLS